MRHFSGEVQSVGRKFGGPQALPPRRDVAYFVDSESAERDAKSFAAYKTRQDEKAGAQEKLGTSDAYSKRHAAFAWDHNIFNPIVQWAVLEWNGEDPEGENVRSDVAYFLDQRTRKQRPSLRVSATTSSAISRGLGERSGVRRLQPAALTAEVLLRGHVGRVLRDSSMRKRRR